MILTLYRFRDTGQETLGVLMVNGVFQCYTLEDTYRKTKIPGKTRIPEETYELGWHDSPKFGPTATSLTGSSLVPHVLDVPNFSYILIHWGNTHKDTHGCILVGKAIKGNKLLSSRDAWKDLVALMKGEEKLQLHI